MIYGQIFFLVILNDKYHSLKKGDDHLVKSMLHSPDKKQPPNQD